MRILLCGMQVRSQSNGLNAERAFRSQFFTGCPCLSLVTAHEKAIELGWEHHFFNVVVLRNHTDRIYAVCQSLTCYIVYASLPNLHAYTMLVSYYALIGHQTTK